MQISNQIKKSVGYDVKITMLLFAIIVTSSVAGQNLIQVFGYTISTGMLIFPLTFVLVATATEIYGFKFARSMIWTAGFCNLFMVTVILLFIKIPSSHAFVGDIAIYQKFSLRLAYLMSISTFAYVISEYVNAWLISRLSALVNGRFLLFRALFSISIAVTVDTWLVFPFFFSRQGNISAAVVETLMDIIIKISYEILLLPLVWFLVAYIRNKNNESRFSDLAPSLSYSSIDYLAISAEEKSK